ncbi:MAG: hypothetical protein QM728_00330 [Gordonia sp. (in: high G+C Gram-positive bacteria)]|uniref:hypothetical protein n=1 Tax=Gordonia sp. (in: high G+C Gram-positive bacteria) TaxID=84139 RepID=UPI0039E2E3A5
MTGACWATAVATEPERTALGLAADANWLLTCRLSDGHSGDHGTDASTAPRSDRRPWLLWNDIPGQSHRIVDNEPCRMHNLAGTQCLLFIAHGGMHFYGNPDEPAPPADPLDISVPLPEENEAAASAPDPGEPLDVEVTTVEKDVVEAVAEPSPWPAAAPDPTSPAPAEPEGDDVREAIDELAAAVEKLAEVLRNRPS